MGVDAFIHDMTTLGFGATLEAELVVYRIVPVDGAYAGTPMETGVAVAELQSWPQVPPSLASLPGCRRVLAHQHRRVPETRMGEPQPSDIRVGRCPRRRRVGEPRPRRPERGGRMMHRTSVAMTAANEDALIPRLVRDDGQEDICLATYRPSTGLTRRTALIRTVVPPEPGDRVVHGNATVTADYILRGVENAQRDGSGLVLLHSHPRGHALAADEPARPRLRGQLRQPCARTHRAAFGWHDACDARSHMVWPALGSWRRAGGRLHPVH